MNSPQIATESYRRKAPLLQEFVWSTVYGAQIWKGGRLLPTVRLREKESPEQLLRRFRKKVTRSGVLGEVRRKRFFTSKSEQRRIEKKKAIRKQLRRKSRES
jgi:small subunit ribosomal protein S21